MQQSISRLTCCRAIQNLRLTQYIWQNQAIQCGTPLHATTGTSSRIGKTLKLYDTEGLMNIGYCAL
jgi:hypothetical protein